MKKIIIVFAFLLVFLCSCSEREETEEITVTVSFQANGGTAISKSEGKTVEKEPITEKPGYYFEGWYETEDYAGNRVIFPYKALATVTLYAKWIDPEVGNEEIEYRLTEEKDGYEAVEVNTDCATVCIPDSHAGLPVVSVLRSFLTVKSCVKKIYIGQNVRTIEERFYRCDLLESFEVDRKNDYYYSDDGVLYSASKQTLIAYPTQKTDEEFVIPEQTTALSENAFWFCDFLKKLTVGKNVACDYTSFKNMTALEYISVEEEHPTLTDVDGVLYSRDKTVLYLYPMCRARAWYEICEETVTVTKDAFSGSQVETVSIGKNVQAFSFSENTPYLKEYIVSAQNKYYMDISGVLFSADGTKLIRYPEQRTGGYSVPDGVVYIYDFAFRNSRLTNIILPCTVEEITYYAFYNSSLQSISFVAESKLSFVAENAFSNCKDLKSLLLTARVVPETGVGVFDDCTDLVIKVPYNLSEYYKAKWSFCQDKIEGSELSVTTFTVTFETDGGTPVQTQHCVVLLEMPVTEKSMGYESDQESYVFLGWFDNPEGIGKSIEFPYAVTQNITLYAVWDIVINE